MESTEIQMIAAIGETITSVGLLLIWIWAERRDNNQLWGIVEKLVELRLSQIENDSHKPQGETD